MWLLILLVLWLFIVENMFSYNWVEPFFSQITSAEEL